MPTTTIQDIIGNTVAFRGASGVGATGIQGASGIGGATGINGASGARGATGATGIVAPWTRITSATTLSANAQYIIDTSGGSFQVTLPASPSVGNVVVIQDGANWTTYPLTILQNGSTIEGQADNLVLNVGGVLVYLLYIDEFEPFPVVQPMPLKLKLCHINLLRSTQHGNVIIKYAQACRSNARQQSIT